MNELELFEVSVSLCSRFWFRDRGAEWNGLGHIHPLVGMGKWTGYR